MEFSESEVDDQLSAREAEYLPNVAPALNLEIDDGLSNPYELWYIYGFWYKLNFYRKIDNFISVWFYTLYLHW